MAAQLDEKDLHKFGIGEKGQHRFNIDELHKLGIDEEELHKLGITGKSLAAKFSLPRYDLLASNDQKQLSKMVSEHLSKGWELYGDPGVAIAAGVNATYIQAVILRPSSD